MYPKLRHVFENFIYISAVSGSLCVGCTIGCYFWLCLWDHRLAGWHLRIFSGLGSNAPKHSVDATCSQLFSLGWADASWTLLSVQYVGRMSNTEHNGIVTIHLAYFLEFELTWCIQSKANLRLFYVLIIFNKLFKGLAAKTKIRHQETKPAATALSVNSCMTQLTGGMFLNHKLWNLCRPHW